MAAPHNIGNDAMSRMRSRDMDVAESYHLLLELGTQEPVLQHCLRTLQGICMAQGIKLKKRGTHDQDADSKQWSSQATDDFQKHLDRHWMPFLEEALRTFFVCGFVPYHLRRLASTGDLVPEVIPLGTYTWAVELRTEKERRREREFTNAKMKMSYVPGVVDGPRKGQAWQNNPVINNIKETEKATDDPESKWNSNGVPKEASSLRTDGIETGDPGGSRRVRQDGETKYVQYRVNMKVGFLFIFSWVTNGVPNTRQWYLTWQISDGNQWVTNG